MDKQLFGQIKLDRERFSLLGQINSKWTGTDYLGMLKVRSSIGRNNYKVQPGLYKLGVPVKESPVFVTANYKLTFDIVRRDLEGIDAWILVLDTKGINVWCAAGKGTMGTQELLNRIKITGLHTYVSHRKIVLPQLAAPGIAAHEIKKGSGFKVIYGPVRSADIPAFLKQNFICTEEMRQVNFSFKDRLILTPVELSNSLKYLAIGLLIILGISGLSRKGYEPTLLISSGLKSMIVLLLAYVSGAFIAPVMLPWVPFRMFSLKGIIVGLTGFFLAFSLNLVGPNLFEVVGWLLLSASVASFLAMNFTGSSTFTSLSGVKKEMAIFVPVQLLGASLGLILVIVSKFFSLWL